MHHCNVFLDFLKNKKVCSIELDKEIWSTMKYNFVNIKYHIFMIIFSTNSKCEPYYKRSTESICDKYLTKLDYVYISGARFGQYTIRLVMEGITSVFPLKPTSECYELIARALCTYYYPKCGYNDTVHVPMTLCSDVCEYVSTQCSVTWVAFKKDIEDRGRGYIHLLDCNNTAITGLNLTNNCCISGGIILPEGILCCICMTNVTTNRS